MVMTKEMRREHGRTASRMTRDRGREGGGGREGDKEKGQSSEEVTCMQHLST